MILFITNQKLDYPIYCVNGRNLSLVYDRRGNVISRGSLLLILSLNRHNDPIRHRPYRHRWCWQEAVSLESLKHPKNY